MKKLILSALCGLLTLPAANAQQALRPAELPASSRTAGQQMEQAYAEVCRLWSAQDPRSRALLLQFLQDYPDSPYAYRIHALIASTLFDEGRYDEALEEFNLSRLELLAPEESYEMQ